MLCKINRTPAPEPGAEDGFFAEVEVINTSDTTVEVVWNHNRMELFTFLVRDQQGGIVAERYLGDRFALRGQPARVKLAPSEGLRTPFHFRVVIPEDAPTPATYSVQAVCSYGQDRIESEPVEVYLTPE